MSILVKELKELQLKSEVAGIARDCSDNIHYGYICKVGNDYAAMHLYMSDGTYGGISVFKLEQITEVLWGNRNAKARAHINLKTSQPETPSFKANGFNDLILEFNEKYSSLEIYSDNDEDFHVGKVISHDDDWIKITTIGEKSSLSQGYALLERDSILRIMVNSPYQTGIMELHELGL